MALFEEEPVRKPQIHEIGQNLSALSVDELQNRIVQLRDEIIRIELELNAKDSTKAAAEALFRR